MSVRVALSVALAAAVLTGGWVVAPVPPSGIGAPSDAGALRTDARALPAFARAANLPADQPIRVGLTVAYTDPTGLDRLLRDVVDPRSPEFRHFLTYPQFEARYAPSPGAVAAVVGALHSAGATQISWRPGSTTVTATLTAAGLSQLLEVRPVEYRGSNGFGEYTVLGTPRLPSALAGVVTGVDGLSGTMPAAPGTLLSGPPERRAPSSTSGGPAFVFDTSSRAEWFVGSDFTQAYQATALLPGSPISVPHASYPYGVAIATLLASSYNFSFHQNLPPFVPGVIDQYFNDTLAPAWPVSNVTGVIVHENGTVDPPAPGSLGIFTDNTGNEAENSLDLEMAGSLAPGAPLYNFYFAGSLIANPTFVGDVAGYLADDLAAALAYNYSPARLGVVSCSFGLPELNNSAWDTELDLAAATGVTVVAASGDQGNAPAAAAGRNDGPAPVWPAAAAFNSSGAVSVGGVSLTLAGTPTSNYTTPPVRAAYDANVQGFSTTSVWYDVPGGFGYIAGTEGGLSAVYPEPYWQFHSAAQPAIVAEAGLQGVRSLGRAGADLAFPANTTIAYISGTGGGGAYYGLIAGTSVAAPVLGGIFADVAGVETATNGRFTSLGFVDPELYRLASYFAAYPSPTGPFLDVVNGSNAVFSALGGWDAPTGWGGLNAPLFLAADENQTERSYVYTGPTPGLPSTPDGPTGLYLVLGLVVGAVGIALAVVVVYARRRPALRAPDVFDPFVLPPSALARPHVAPPSFATFACPYCGKERPAEAGPCPTCGIS